MVREKERQTFNVGIISYKTLDNNLADICLLVQVTTNRSFCEDAHIMATEPSMTVACKPLVQHVTRGALK